jgi:hypothetical protein
MRLIDADALKHTLCELERRAGFGTIKDSLDGFKLLIDHAPTVDAVPVVWCKDCKYWERKDGLVIGYCGAAKHGYKSTNWDIGIYRMTMDTGYCSDGERREE